MNIQEAKNLAEKDIQEGKEWRVIAHPESPEQCAYDMERWFFENWTSLEEYNDCRY